MKRILSWIPFLVIINTLVLYSVSALTNVSVEYANECESDYQANWNDAHDSLGAACGTYTGSGTVISQINYPSGINIRKIALRTNMTNYTGCAVTSAKLFFTHDTGSTSVSGADNTNYSFALVANVTIANDYTTVAGDFDSMGIVDNPLVISDFIDINPELNANEHYFTILPSYLYLLNERERFWTSLRGGFDISDIDIGSSNGWTYYLNENSLHWEIECGVVSPSLTLNTNLVNGTENYNKTFIEVYFNGTLSATTTDIYNCSLNVLDSVNMTLNDINLTQNQLFNFTYGYKEQWFNFSVNCSNFEASDSTDTYYYNVDSITPNFLTDFINNTVYNDSDIFNFYGNASDSNLFAVIVNITNDADNSVLVSNFTENITNAFIQMHLTHTFTTADIGNYTVYTLVADSHNPIAETVRDLPSKWENNNLIADNDITFKGDLKHFDNKGRLATYFYLSENRYKFKVTFNNDSKMHTLELITRGNLNFISDSDYKGHFVYLFNRRFIDFEGKNIKSVDVTEVSRNHYIIELHLYNSSDEIELESIGDLNIIESKYYFTVVATPDLNTQQLQQLNTTVIKIYGVLNMLWFTILLIAGLFSPFLIQKFSPKNMEFGYIISLLLFALLLYLNAMLNYFDLTSMAQAIINIILLVLFIMYALQMETDSKDSDLGYY